MLPCHGLITATLNKAANILHISTLNLSHSVISYKAHTQEPFDTFTSFIMHLNRSCNKKLQNFPRLKEEESILLRKLLCKQEYPVICSIPCNAADQCGQEWTLKQNVGKGSKSTKLNYALTLAYCHLDMRTTS